jgi:hypothetical protein
MENRSEPINIRVSRTKITHIECNNPTSIGASYTWISSLDGVVGPDTSRIVMYHAKLTSLKGLENSRSIQHAYLGFNMIEKFRPDDAHIKHIDVLDLVGNPIASLLHCPPCRELIVSSTLIEDLTHCPDTVEILRIGHSTQLKSLRGCPESVRILECSCAPNLVIEDIHLPKQLKELHRGKVVNILDNGTVTGLYRC